MTGFYLAIEGGDGAGKTTVANALRTLLEDQGDTVIVVREPGGTPLGEEVRRLLLHSAEMTPWAEAMLFAAQRAQLAVDVISPALRRGEVVISDRSLYSSLAYQGGGRGLGVERVKEVNLIALSGVTPDLVVVLEVDPQAGLARQSDPDRIGRQGGDFQAEVARTYRKLAADEPDRVVLIDASSEPEHLARMINALVGERRNA